MQPLIIFMVYSRFRVKNFMCKSMLNSPSSLLIFFSFLCTDMGLERNFVNIFLMLLLTQPGFCLFFSCFFVFVFLTLQSPLVFFEMGTTTKNLKTRATQVVGSSLTFWQRNEQFGKKLVQKPSTLNILGFM